MKSIKLHVSIICILIPLLLLTSCEGFQHKPDTTDEDAKNALYELMNYAYFWYNKMPIVNKRNYDEPYSLLEAMRYRPIDIWSFIADYHEFMSEMQGDFFGHGIAMGLDNEGNVRITMIYNQSQLYQNGVRRGWVVKTIAGRDIASVIMSNDVNTYNNIMGQSTAEFVFENPDGETVQYSSTRTSFTVNAVLHYDTLHLKSGITGHLVYESFIESSIDELDEAFDFFKKANVEDIIVDFRYNGGGYLDIANQISSYIVGNDNEGDFFAGLKHNDKIASEDTAYMFYSTPHSLDLSRAVFITSRATASASEAVINGLKPYVTVALVGDTTHGKPMGMDGYMFKTKYLYFPITFKLINADGEGEYYNGMVPDILCSDDITHDFGDRDEACLAAAINYLETGSTSPSKGFSKTITLSESPEWKNNLFLKKDF